MTLGIWFRAPTNKFFDNDSNDLHIFDIEEALFKQPSRTAFTGNGFTIKIRSKVNARSQKNGNYS